jgi:hypothetical protein
MPEPASPSEREAASMSKQKSGCGQKIKEIRILVYICTAIAGKENPV